MKRAYKIIRISLYYFLQNYHYFTITSALLAFPFASSFLFSQSITPPLFSTIYNRFKTLFDGAGLPDSEYFTIFNLKLSQTLTSSLFSLPFTLTFLLISKASIIQTLFHHNPIVPSSFCSIISLYNPLLHTYIWNLLILLSANATAFSIIFLSFNLFDHFGFSSPNWTLFFSAGGLIVYSIIVANAFIICNLALILSGMEKQGGHMAILQACVLIRERTSTALALTLPANFALASIEALFHYRIVRAYLIAERLSSAMALEGIFIAYLYSILLVVDTIVNCLFFKSCKARFCLDEERRYTYSRDKIADEECDV